MDLFEFLRYEEAVTLIFLGATAGWCFYRARSRKVLRAFGTNGGW